MRYYINALLNWTFGGRASRKEYWMFVLFHNIVSILVCTVDILLNIYIFGMPLAAAVSSLKILSLLYSLAALIPSIAVLVRRLHDTEHSGAWYFISLIPLIGFIILLVFLCTEGTYGDNQYGAAPGDSFYI